MITRCDPLRDLAQFRALEELVQFRLADEDHLQLFSLVVSRFVRRQIFSRTSLAVPVDAGQARIPQERDIDFRYTVVLTTLYIFLYPFP